MAKDVQLPPQNIDAEQAVLGSLLIDPEAIIQIGDKLKPEQFYRGSHQKIYAAMLSLFERREPADVLTVSNELKESNDLETIGGEGYLAELVNAVPTSVNIQSYSGIVRENAIRRELISAASRITKDSFETAKSVRDLLQETEQAIFGISQENLTRTFIPIRDTLMESFDKLEDLQKNKTGVRGVPTGFRDIDNKLSGLQDSNLVILAARPSVGKTALALNISQYIAVHQKVPVGFFSLEMSRDELVNRLLASQSGIDYWKVTTGNLNEEDFGRLGDAMGILAEAPLFIDDSPGISVHEMRTKARRLQIEQKVRLIVVDYLQLAVSRNLINRVQEVSEISQGLKNLARELKCPVLAISQLSRGVEQRGEQRPQLSDLRDSGCLSGDTRIQLADGRRVSIGELSQSAEAVEVLSLDEQLIKLVPVKVKKVWKTGEKEVCMLTTKLGRQVKATSNHRFKTDTGWKRLDELTKGDFLALPRNLSIDIPTDRIGQTDRLDLTEWLKELGVWGLRSYQKFVPSVLFSQPDDVIACFLTHLWATDGCVGVFGKKNPRPLAYFATSSEVLATDVQTLLLRLGIIARVRPVSQGTKGHTQFHAIVTGKTDLELFMQRVGVWGPKWEKGQEVLDYYIHRSGNTNRDIIPPNMWRDEVESCRKSAGLSQRALQARLGLQYNGTAFYRSGLSRERALTLSRLLKSPKLNNLSVSDIYWDRVYDIKPVGTVDVFDIEVPRLHNFVAENIVVHNSIEQDADVVMFLWRPNEEEKDRPDHVKLTIAKHRNGPVGEIDLIFKGEQTRFYSMEKKRQET